MNMCLCTIEPLCCTPETDIEIKYFPIIFYKKAMGRIRRLDTAEEGIWKNRCERLQRIQYRETQNIKSDKETLRIK